MRKRILIGVISAAIATIVVGNFMFTRNAQAQDLPKPPEPAKKDEAGFEYLKKLLDAKAQSQSLPSLPQPAPIQSTPTIQPPMKVEAKDAPITFPPIESKPAVSPIPPVENKNPNPTFPPLEHLNPKKPEVAPPGSTIQPRNDDVRTITPPTVSQTPALQSTGGVPTFPPTPKDIGVKPAIGPDTASPTPTPLPQKLTPPPAPGLIQQLAKPANSPWALHVEVIEGRTIVTATVNKKHEFKIICDSLDLQTGKGTLKASGKVRINGDALQGHCNELSIPLNEDRLVLDGNAEVRIQRVTTTVSSESRPATFELKGDSLNLRISELQSSAHLIETHWRRTDDISPRNRVVPASLTTDNKQWSSWGTLRKSTEKIDGLPAWRLENATGSVIATLVTREGGTLTQYEGRSISVFGTNEQMNGRTVLRVSHIALP